MVSIYFYQALRCAGLMTREVHLEYLPCSEKRINKSKSGDPVIHKKTLQLCIAVILVVCVSQQASGAQKRKYDCTKHIHTAIEKYQKKYYNGAKTLLADAKYNCSGHQAMDTLLYYLGKCDLKVNSPAEARIEFDRLIQDFPTSAFSDETHFLLGYCSYLESNPVERDQEKTHQAIRDLSEFIDRFPQSAYIDSARKFIGLSMEKLAQKNFNNARFYEKVDQFESAIVYYKYVIADYPQSKLSTMARLAIAQNLVALSRSGEAKVALQELLSSKPADATIVRKATALMEQIEGSGSGSPGIKRSGRKRGASASGAAASNPAAQPTPIVKDSSALQPAVEPAGDSPNR
jgi:outer membrane protein assembly factor BamD